MIKIENLSIKYKNQDNNLFSNLTVDMNPGDYILIDGDNGTGKTTFLETLVGINFQKKDINGKIIIDGKNLQDMSQKDIQDYRSQICYLSQIDDYDSYYDDTVLDVLEDSYRGYINPKINSTAKEYISNVFKQYVSEDSNITLKSKIRKLSGGQKRLVSIIASICLRKDAKIFIIDEPLNNLDFKIIKLISNLLNKIVRTNPNCLLLMVSHCKIFPFINRVIRLGKTKCEDNRYIPGDNKICLACFGKANEEGYY